MSSHPIAVLIVSNHGHIVGGGEISLLALLRGLDRSRWSPTVVVPSDGEVAEQCRKMGFRCVVVPLPTIRRPRLQIVKTLAKLYALSREVEAKLIHANGSRAMFYAGLAGKVSGCPVIWHVRVADRDSFLDAILTRLATIILVNSQAVGTRFAQLAKFKLCCIYNGVDLAEFSPRRPSPRLRHALNLPPECRIVMSVGRFVPYKGYNDLIEAAALVHSELPPTRWVLVGDGEIRQELMEQTKTSGLEHQFHFLGWRNDIPDLLALCDVFVLPSHAEHFGRVLIEAMAMAKAVVATASGGVPEIVAHEETGLLVPPGNALALGKAISFLLAKPGTAEKFGEAGRKRAAALFSLETHLASVQKIYEKCLEA